MEETEAEDLTPEMIYRPKDLVWVKISGMWWPCEVMDQETLAPDVTGGLKKKPLVVVKFLEDAEDSYEFVRSYDIIYHYNCKRKEEFLALGFKKYSKLKNEKNMAMFPTTIQEAERRTGGDPEIIHDPKYLPQEAQGPSKAENGGRSSLPASFKGKKSTASRRSAPGTSKDGDTIGNGVVKSKIERPAIVKQGPTWYPYPHNICVVFGPRRKPPSDDPSLEITPLRRCSLCCFETPYYDMLELHYNNNQHNTTSTQGGYRWRNPLNKIKTTSGSKKTPVVRRKKDSTSTSAEKGSAKKKKKSLPPVPVGEFTPPKKPKMSSPGTPNSREVKNPACAMIFEDWDDDEDENKPSDETGGGDLLDSSASTTDTTAEAAKLGKGAEKLSNSDKPTPKVDKPLGPPKSSSCFDFDEEEPSEPDLQSSGKFGQIRLPRVITPEKSKPPDPLDDGNDIDSLLKEVSVPDIPSLPPSKQDSLFSRGDKTYGSSPFKDTKKPGVTSHVKSDSDKDKNADVENNKNDEKHFLAKGPLQSKKRKSFGRTEGAEDGSDVKNKYKVGVIPPKPSNEMKMDAKTSKIDDKTSAAEKAKQSLIDTLTYSPKSDEVQSKGSSMNDGGIDETTHGVSLKKSREADECAHVNRDTAEVLGTNDQVPTSKSSPTISDRLTRNREHQEMAEPTKLPGDEAQSNKVARPTADAIQSTPKPSRKSGRKKSQESVGSPSLPVNEVSKREGSPEDSESPGSARRNKRLKSSRKVPELHSAQLGCTSELDATQESVESMMSPSAVVETSDSIQPTPKQSRKSSRNKEHTKSLSLPLGETSKRENSPEEPDSPRSSKKNKKFKSSTEMPELQVVPDGTVADKTLETAESQSPQSQPPSEHAPSDKTRSRKSKKVGSPEGQLKVQLEQPSEIPEVQSVPEDDTLVGVTQGSAEPLESPSAASDSLQSASRKASRRKSKNSESPSLPLDGLSKREASPEDTRSPRSSRRNKKFKFSQEVPEQKSSPVDSSSKVEVARANVDFVKSPSSQQVTSSNNITQEPVVEMLPSIPTESASKANTAQEHVATGSSLTSEQTPPSDSATSRESSKHRSSSGECKVQPVMPDTPELLSIPVDSTLNTEITQECTQSIKSPSHDQLPLSKDIALPLSKDIAQEPVCPRASKKTKKHESSEGIQEAKTISDQDSEQLKSLARVATSKETLEIDQPHKLSRRSKRNRSQEVPVSIPLPEDCLPKSISVDQKLHHDSCESLGSPTTLEALPKVDDSSQASRKSKRFNFQELPVSIPLPEADFSIKENSSKIPESLTSPARDVDASQVHLVSLQDSSKADESPKSSQKSKNILSTVEVPVSIPLYDETDLLKDNAAISDLIIPEESPTSSRKSGESRACSTSANLKTLKSEEPPKSDGISTGLEGDSEAMEPPSKNKTSTPAVLEDSQSKEQLNAAYTLAAEKMVPLKSASLDTASTEISNTSEPHVPSRKSKRISSQEALTSKSTCEVDTPKSGTKANEQKRSSKKSKTHALPQERDCELLAKGESSTLKIPEDLKPMESSKHDKMALTHEEMVSSSDSKEQTLPSEEPHNKEAIPAAQDSKSLKSSSVDNTAILAEDSKTNEPLAPSRRSKRISSQEVLTSKSLGEVDTPKSVTASSKQEQSSRKSKRHRRSQEPESKRPSAVESDELQEELKPVESSKDDPMALVSEPMGYNDSKPKPSVAEDPNIVGALLPAEISEPPKLPSVDKLSPEITVEDSKASEPPTSSRTSKRIFSQKVSASKSLFEVDSPKTETIASEIPHGSLEPTEVTSKVSEEVVPLIQEHISSDSKESRQDKEKSPEAKPLLEEEKPQNEVLLREEASDDLSKNVVDLPIEKEISSTPSTKKSKLVETKLLPEVVTPKPDEKKVSSRGAESKIPSKEAKPKEKDRKSASKSHRHETSGRESRNVSKEDKDKSKPNLQEHRSRRESKASKTESSSKEKKKKDKEEHNSASIVKPASQVAVDPKGVEGSVSPSIVQKESPSKDVASSQISKSNDLFDSLFSKKKKSKWDVDVHKAEEISKDTVETVKNVDSNSGATVNAGENTSSELKPLEITVFDCSNNEVAVDKDLAVASPKKEMAYSPSKTFRQDEAASLLEELLGSSPKSSPASSPKKAKVSPVTHDNPGLRSRTADIKFSLSPSKVLDFGSPPKADASGNRTENLCASDAPPAPVRASRWDSPIRSSGIRSSTPTQSLAASPPKTPRSPGRTVKVWEIKSGARTGVKSSLPENNVAPEKQFKQPVHLEPDSSNNQSDDELSALQAEIMSYSEMDKVKSTPAPAVTKEVSDLARELEDPPDSPQCQTTTPAPKTSPSMEHSKKESFPSPSKSVDATSHVSPQAIPLQPEPASPLKPSGMSEADLLAQLSSDAISFPLFEPGTAESVTPLAPDTVSSTNKPSGTPSFIVVRSDSTQGSESIPCAGTERQAVGSGADLRVMDELLDINNIPIILSDNLMQDASLMTYSEATIPTVIESTSGPAVPIVSAEPVSSIPLPGEKPEQLPPIVVVSSAPIISSSKTSGQVQNSTTPSVTVPSVHSISVPPEPSVQEPQAPEPEEASKEEIIETEIVMDHSETEQDCLTSAQSIEDKFARALEKQPWLRPDLLEDLTKRATEKKVYEVKKVTQLVISLYDEDHPDYSYYMSLPPCSVGTSCYTPSWAEGPRKTMVSSTNPSKNVSSVTKPASTGVNSQTPTANHSSVSRPEKVAGEVVVADSSKPVSPVKAVGAQVKQKILQILNQFQSGKYDADTARKLESITSSPGFLDKINQQQKVLVSSQLPADVQPTKTSLATPVVRASTAGKTVTSVPGSPAVASPKSVLVVSTSNAKASQQKPNILSAGREPLKFTMESKYRNIQMSSGSPKFVVIPDPVTGIPSVKQQFVIRNNTTQPGSTVSAGRIVTTQTNNASSTGPGRSAGHGTAPTFTMVSPRSTSTLQNVVNPGRSNLPIKTPTTVNPGSSTGKVTTTLPRQRLKTAPQPVLPTARLSQPQTLRVRKQSLQSQTTQFVQRPTGKTESITYVTLPNNMVIPASSEQVYVVTKKKPPVPPSSDILAEALAGAEIPFTEEPSPDLLSPASVVSTGSLGADQLSTMSFDPAETECVNR